MIKTTISFGSKGFFLVLLILLFKSGFSQKPVKADTCQFFKVKEEAFVVSLKGLLIDTVLQKFINNNTNQIQCFYLENSVDNNNWAGVLMLINKAGIIDSAFKVLFNKKKYNFIPVKLVKVRFPAINNFSTGNYFVKDYQVEDGVNELLLIKNKNTFVKGIISFGKPVPVDRLHCDSSLAGLIFYSRKIIRK